MSSVAAKGIVVGLAASLAFAVAAQAKTGTVKKTVAAKTVAVRLHERGADRFPAGPVYVNGEYMGDDPDPFIRFMLMRDMGAHHDGAQ